MWNIVLLTHIYELPSTPQSIIVCQNCQPKATPHHGYVTEVLMNVMKVQALILDKNQIASYLSMSSIPLHTAFVDFHFNGTLARLCQW